MLSPEITKFILHQTRASAITTLETIQSLWSGYGSIVKVGLEGAPLSSVVVKNISLPDTKRHPRGWNTNRSHARKLHSYEVEMNWYQNWNDACTSLCRIPRHLGSRSSSLGDIIILEDIDAAGFPERKSRLTKQQTLPCLKWLANFHATFLNQSPSGLWQIGTYWHLDTRPDELAAMEDGPLKEAAKAIDTKLNECEYKTLVHGDAKVANFCFSENGENVAAVDFQYIGGGCGIKDVIYFLGSCLDETECERWAHELLDHYFFCLRNALTQKISSIEIDKLEEEWRSLYSVAWTDFYRFLKGWMPDHFKINSYSDSLAESTLNSL
ncbi:DUF1679 domain-containing protein [Puniceicoccaceae bacterium K14]|nr:DUF1679 domain-containing protein [Puniceicoccaceae bacterium K14]